MGSRAYVNVSDGYTEEKHQELIKRIGDRGKK